MVNRDSKVEFLNIFKKIKKYISNEDFKKIENLLNNYLDSLSSGGDITEINKIKKEIFEFEKKYLPDIDEHVNLKNKLNPEILLMTVGMQKEPLILSILILKPIVVYLLCTSKSTITVKQIMDDEKIKELGASIHIIEISEDDLTSNYRKINEIIIQNKDRKIVSDPTGGRKMMNTSLSFLSIYFRIPMVYLNGIEFNKNIIPFSERLILIENPLDFYGDIELQLIQEMFNSHYYDAAIKICESLIDKTKDLTTLKKIELLIELIKIYNKWDKFEHSNPDVEPNLSKELEEIKRKFERFGLKSNLPENIENNINFLKELEERWSKGKVNMIDEYRIIDIFLNAKRRGSMKQCKYDDAIARLYRIVEMLNTYFLLKFGLKSTEKPDYNNFAKKLSTTKRDIKNKYKEIFNTNLPKERIGLENQKNLLKVLIHYSKDDSIKFLVNIQESSQFKELMKKRNRSILAHGTVSLNENDWVNFRDKIEALLIKIFGKSKYNELMNLGKHGPINLFV